MKIQHLIPILFLAAFCTVSAQTNTSATPALLTTNQAEAIAIRLANDKMIETYESLWVPKIYPFRLDKPGRVETNINGQRTIERIVGGTIIDTCFTNGHWNSSLSTVFEYKVPSYYATVELAPDGSTNSIKVNFSANNRLP